MNALDSAELLTVNVSSSACRMLVGAVTALITEAEAFGKELRCPAL